MAGMEPLDTNMTCSACGSRWDGDVLGHRCACGGTWRIESPGEFTPERIDREAQGLWRYREAMAVDGEPVTMGEGGTPLVEWTEGGNSVRLKLDYACPTGSYKDRGAAAIVTHFRQFGVDRVCEDSSGNAGAALAAYVARAGMHAEIFVPADVHPGKLAQIRAHGATVRQIPGDRAATAQAVLERAEEIPYASHNWHPVFLEGTKTLALEMTEQLGWQAPAAVVCPLGFGSVLLGLAYGFDLLRTSGVIERVPKLVGVQAAGCAPIAEAWSAGRDEVPPIAEPAATPADGIVAASPIRGEEILSAIRTSGGAAVAVEPEAVFAGMERLAGGGFYVEPTSAVVVDGYRQAIAAGIVDSEALTVMVLTGSGLKATEAWTARHGDAS